MRNVNLRYIAQIISNSAYLLSSDLGTLAMRHTSVQCEKAQRDIRILQETLERAKEAVYDLQHHSEGDLI